MVSAAKPKIANYAFTTLEPNLGIVSVRDDHSFVTADIPGIIEGAHEGRGLGTRFLRHIERNSVLLFMIPADSDDIAADYDVLLGELSQYNPELLDKQRLLAVTKCDMLDDELIEQMRSSLPEGIGSVFISSVSGLNIARLKDMLWAALQEKITAAIYIMNIRCPVRDSVCFSILYNPVIGYAERIFAVEIVHDAVSAEPTLRHYIAGIFGIARREDRERVARLIDKAAAGIHETVRQRIGVAPPHAALLLHDGKSVEHRITRYIGMRQTARPQLGRLGRRLCIERYFEARVDVALGYTVDAVNAGRRRTQHYLASVVAQRKHVAMYRHLAI